LLNQASDRLFVNVRSFGRDVDQVDPVNENGSQSRSNDPGPKRGDLIRLRVRRPPGLRTANKDLQRLGADRQGSCYRTLQSTADMRTNSWHPRS
jgi:hypothetical protein